MSRNYELFFMFADWADVSTCFFIFVAPPLHGTSPPTKFCPTQSADGPNSTKLGLIRPTMVPCWPMLYDFGQNWPGFHQLRPIPDHSWARSTECGQIRPNLGRIRPILARIWPNPEFVQNRPTLAAFDRLRPGFHQLWPISTEVGPIYVKYWPNSTDVWVISAEFGKLSAKLGPDSNELDPFRPNSVQLGCDFDILNPES